jgi:uncharacterized membrane protein YeaQ/YmgE (transglycosylase-associated protein family)
MMHSILALQDITNQPIVVQTTLGQVITWIIIGAVAGLFASVLVRGRGMGLGSSIILGLIGAIVGGFIFSLLGVQATGPLAGALVIRWIDIVVAFIGALLILMLASIFWHRRY